MLGRSMDRKPLWRWCCRNWSWIWIRLTRWKALILVFFSLKHAYGTRLRELETSLQKIISLQIRTPSKEHQTKRKWKYCTKGTSCSTQRKNSWPRRYAGWAMLKLWRRRAQKIQKFEISAEAACFGEWRVITRKSHTQADKAEEKGSQRSPQKV